MKRLLTFVNPERARLITFIWFLASVPCFLICRTRHFCVFGHLEDQTSFWDYANDVLWRSGFVVGMILCFRSDITFRYVFTFALSVGFLLCASPLGLLSILIYPVTAASCLFALASLLGWID